MTAEVEETYFSKRKNPRVRMLPEQCVLGGICRESKDVFMIAVQNSKEETLLECIKRKY